MPFTIYFGGMYEECWTEDYTMTVKYVDPYEVVAKPDKNGIRVLGGDTAVTALLEIPEEYPLYTAYLEAAVAARSAAETCRKHGFGYEMLREIYSLKGNPFAAPELMRTLMDDCGCKLEKAYEIVLDCCGNITEMPGYAEALKIQPRVAHIIKILEKCQNELPYLTHNAACSNYRNPLGAVRCGDKLTLNLSVLSGKVESADLILLNGEERTELPMVKQGAEFSASFTVSGEPVAAEYLFRVVCSGSVNYVVPDGSGFTSRMSGTEEAGFRLTVFDRAFDTPEWFRNSIMYQVFPDRFACSDDDTAQKGIEYHKALGQTPELHRDISEPVRYLPREFEKSYSPDDFYGGTLKGIKEKLPYLAKLGIGCLYLNPIFEARSNHRYDTSDYLRIDPVLGTEEDFEDLTEEAGALGIRIILDGVFSHTGADSIYFNAYGSYGPGGACRDKNSNYFSWYDYKDYPDEYRCWWGFRDLPEVEETNACWQEFVVSGENSVIKKWLKAGASGWRLDVADEIPDEVLELIRKSVKETSPDAPVIGEVWEDPVTKISYGKSRRYALGRALDSVMNYPLRTAIIDFVKGRQNAYVMRDFLLSQKLNYPQPLYYSLMNLIGSHDVERIRNALAADVNLKSLSREDQLKVPVTEKRLSEALELEKLCAVIQFVLPGVPDIYYGDEQGMIGTGDPFNRAFFRESEDNLLDFYTVLCRLRNSSAALRTGMVEFEAPRADVLVIKRFISDSFDAFGCAAENECIIAVINTGNEAYEYETQCCGKSAAGIVEGHRAVLGKV